MNEKEEEPIYCMTIELEKGKPEQINIYRESNGNELAFTFCKEHDLDFAAFDYLKNQIDELLFQFRDKTSNGAECELDECNLIEELEDENLVTEENKRTEENKNNKSLSEEEERDIESDSRPKQFITEESNKEITPKQLNQTKSDDNNINILIDNSYNNNDELVDLIYKKDNNPNSNRNNNTITNQQCDMIKDDNAYTYGSMEYFDKDNNKTDDDNNNNNKNDEKNLLKRTSPRLKPNSKHQAAKFTLINKQKYIQDPFSDNNKHDNANSNNNNNNDKNTDKNHEINQLINKKSDFRTSKDSNQLNSYYIEAPLSVSNIDQNSFSIQSKPKQTYQNNSTISNNQDSNSNLSRSTQRKIIKKEIENEEDIKSISSPSTLEVKNSRRNNIKSNQINVKGKHLSNILPLVSKNNEQLDKEREKEKEKDKDKESFRIKDHCHQYYSELGFIDRMEYFKVLYKQRKHVRKLFTQSAYTHDESGQILFKPRLITNYHDITYSKHLQDNQKDTDKSRDKAKDINNVFDKNYHYAIEYKRDKEELCKRINDTMNETKATSFTKRKNEQIISNLHHEVFTSLFSELDTDQDDLITYISINTKNTNGEVMRIIMPLITELKEDKQMLKKNEFILAMHQLYIRLPKREQEILINELKKKNSANKKSMTIVDGSESENQFVPFKNRNTKFLAKRHDVTLKQTYSKYIPMIQKRYNVDRNNYFKQKRLPVFEQTSFNGKFSYYLLYVVIVFQNYTFDNYLRNLPKM